MLSGAGSRRYIDSKTRSTNDGIYIRALNLDNHRDVKRIVKLFRSSHGSSHPIPEVLNPDYWTTSDDDHRITSNSAQVTSIVAVHKDRFIAHLGLKGGPNTEDTPNCREIVLPAIHPAYRKRVFKLSRLFWNCISDQAKKQNWHLVYHYSLMSHPMWQLIAAKCFNSRETAIFPSRPRFHGCNKNTIRRPDTRRTFLVMYNVFQSQTTPSKNLYPPLKHLEQIRNMYVTFKLERNFLSTISTPEISAQDPSTKHAALNSSLHLCITKKTECGFDIVLVNEQQMYHPNNLAQAIADYEDYYGRQVFVQISLENPLCPNVCAELEKRNYRFCGVLPLVDGKDHVIYSQFPNVTLEELTLYTKRAKALRDYMLNSGRPSENPFDWSSEDLFSTQQLSQI